MKKMLLLLAGMVCLGMFVSCGDDTQDVSIVDMIASVKLIGYAEGTVIAKNSVASYTYGIDKQKWADLTYSETQKGCRDYTLKVTVTRSNLSTGKLDDTFVVSIEIVEIDGKYYSKSDQQEIEVKGSLAGGDFTIMAIATTNYSFTNLKFKEGVAK